MDFSTALFGQIHFYFNGCMFCFKNYHLLKKIPVLTQTVYIQIRRRLRRLIIVYTVCQRPFYVTLGINGCMTNLIVRGKKDNILKCFLIKSISGKVVQFQDRRENSVKLFCLPSVIRSTLKGKNLLSKGTKFNLLE